jgi:leukotriene-A4 hydrolase
VQWLNGDGLDLCVDVQYDDTLSKPCAELASRWHDAKKDESKLDEFSSKDMEDFITQQKGQYY